MLVNGNRVVGQATLRDGDLLKIGSTEFKLYLEAATVAVSRRWSSRTGVTRRKSGFLKPWMAVFPVLLLVAVAGALLLTGGNKPKTVTELVNEAKPSTLFVKSFYGSQPWASGSGWVYSANDGLVVTNAHVLGGATRFEVSLEGEPIQRGARVIGVATCEDIAVLGTARTKDLRTFPIDDPEDPPVQGEEVIAVGYPGNASTADELQVTTGSLSALNIDWDQPADEDIDFNVYPDVHQVDAAINPGNSGGPLMDLNGKLIGMNSTGSGGDNQGFAISSDRLREIVPDLAAGDSLGWAGFTFTAMSSEDLNSLADEWDFSGNWERGGLLVDSVIPGSSPAGVGLGYRT